MKSVLALLSVGMFVAGTAQSQTRVTTPTSATTTTGRASGRPPAVPASSTAASPNHRQELYDQYHSVTKKPSSLAPASQPIASVPVASVERPVSLDGSASGVRIGIRGGASRLVYLERLVGIDIDPTLGFVGGFVFNVGRGKLSFQPELNYTRYAYRVNGPIRSTANIANDRLEVPLLLKIASGLANSTRFFVNIGPYGAYVSSASVNSQKISLDGSTGRFSFGAAAGLGAALKAGPGHITLELRGLYELGNADNGVNINTDSNVINAQATMGYMVPLGGR